MIASATTTDLVVASTAANSYDKMPEYKLKKSLFEQIASWKVSNMKISFDKGNANNIPNNFLSVIDSLSEFNNWCCMYSKWMLRILLENTIAQKTLLALCGDVESNPGPPTKKKSKEKPPDEKQIMKEKVERHDAKVDEFEALIKAQAEAIEELKQKQVELVRGVEEQKVEHQQRVEEVKVEAANHLNEMKSAMESQLADQKVQMEAKLADQVVQLEAKEVESKSSMAEMSTELIRLQVEGEIVAETHLALKFKA